MNKSLNFLTPIPCGVLVIDAEGQFVWINAFAETLLGYTVDELIGKRIDLILTVASRMYLQTHIYPLVTLGQVANELYLTLQTQTKHRIPVLLNASRAEQSGQTLFYISFIPVYQRREYEQELLAAKQAAEEALLRNDELVQLQDELNRNQIELDRQISDLRQRKDELEQFGKIISHDLQEPLRKTLLFAGMLADERPDALSDMGKLALTGIGNAGARLRQLIGDLQSYFTLNTSVVQPEPVDLTELIRDLAREIIPADARFDLHPLPTVMGDRAELRSLFRHLLDNAVKFRQPGQSAQVRIDGTVVGRNTFRTIPDKYNYVNYARVTVSDWGIGFNNNQRDEIFRILKRLHTHLPGIGLGLAMAKKIVGRHDGQIVAESTAEHGTRFTIWLPIASQ